MKIDGRNYQFKAMIHDDTVAVILFSYCIKERVEKTTKHKHIFMYFIYFKTSTAKFL